MSNFMNEKIVPKIMKFVNTKGVLAVKDGMVYSMPLLIVGSIFLILANFPVPAVANALEASGISSILSQTYGATFNISAMIAVMGIAYNYAKLEGQEPFSGGVIALGVFLTIQPSSTVTANGDVVGNIILRDWTAGKGMIGAIIVGLLVGWAYSWFLKKNIRIKMPAGVPAGVANAFSALIPAAVIVTVTAVVQGVFTLCLNTTAMEMIYKMIQVPMQGLTDSLPGAIVMCFLYPFLWVFGVHGSTVVGGIMDGLLQANCLENQAILDAGMELTVANGGHIVTKQFVDQFITVTGCGVTIGIVIFMVFLAKSKQLKMLGRLELIPALFNINEPLMFGIPIVMNPIMAIPFIAVPVLSCIIEYFALATGLCPLYGAVQVPWTCPPIISGLLIGGWRTALLQVVVFAMSFFVYLPFIRRVDKMNLDTEAASEQASDEDDEDW